MTGFRNICKRTKTLRTLQPCSNTSSMTKSATKRTFWRSKSNGRRLTRSFIPTMVVGIRSLRLKSPPAVRDKSKLLPRKPRLTKSLRKNSRIPLRTISSSSICLRRFQSSNLGREPLCGGGMPLRRTLTGLLSCLSRD